MPRIEVQPDLLGRGGTRQSALAGRVLEGGSAASGEDRRRRVGGGRRRRGGEIGSFGTAWASALEYLAASIEARGANVSAAAGAYVTTDKTVVGSAKAR